MVYGLGLEGLGQMPGGMSAMVISGGGQMPGAEKCPTLSVTGTPSAGQRSNDASGLNPGGASRRLNGPVCPARGGIGGDVTGVASGRLVRPPSPVVDAGNESAPIQLNQCWFTGLAISNAKIQTYT